MTTAILATKLYIPSARSHVVPRPDLIARLNNGLQRKLTLISAPAGFGKSTLVSQWIATLNRPVAWLSLDETDQDPTRFLAYTIAALDTILPNTGANAVAMLHAPQPAPIKAILTTLLNELAANPTQFALVLDDYHLIDNNIVDDALNFLVEHMPPHMHLIISTREDPQLSLARLRVRAQLSELRVADLRFSATEAAGFLNETMGLSLSPENINALEARTEGWIAGLQLAGISMQRHTDIPAFIKAFTGSHHFILDYLVEEVLQHQPPHVRQFLLQTAILNRLNSPLCDAVRGQTDSHKLLTTLERGNLFLVPLDDDRIWYRYHHLFAEVLQAHLQAEQPDTVALLHQRASDWFAGNAQPAAAIRHAHAAKDLERVANIAELAWTAMDGSFQTATWLEWTKNLTSDIIRNRPVLSVAFAWALLNNGDLDAAEAYLQEAERCLDAGGQMVIIDEEQFRFLPASIASARTYYAQAFGDMSQHHQIRATSPRPFAPRCLHQTGPRRLHSGTHVLGKWELNSRLSSPCRCHEWVSAGRANPFRHQWHIWLGRHENRPRSLA